MSKVTNTSAAIDPQIPDGMFCRVCGSPATKIRCGIIACEACKKFFLRNRDNLSSLQCITDRGDCVVSCHAAATAANSKRSACSRCRLVKCFAAGMRIKGNVYTKPRSRRRASRQSDGLLQNDEGHAEVECEADDSELVDITTHHQRRSSTSSPPLSSSYSSSSSPPSSTTDGANFASAQFQISSSGDSRYYGVILKQQGRNPGLTFSPTDAERASVHLTLKMVMEAVAELSVFQSLPWTIRRDVIRSDHQMWALTMECFDFAVISAFSFIKQLPGYDEIPLADRCHLFAGAFIPLVVGQVTLPGCEGAAFFGQNEYNHDMFFRCFPHFLNLESVINAAGASMKAWQPTFIEHGILQALLFFQVDTLGQLLRPDLVLKMHHKLKQALRSYYETNKELYLNIHHFMRTYNLLRQVETTYDVDMYVFANKRPDLIHKNRLFAEMFFLPAEGREQRWYQMNLHALEGPPKNVPSEEY